MAVVLVALGALLFLNGGILFFYSNFHLGIILTLFLGMFFILWGIFFKKINTLSKKGPMKFIRAIVVALLCIELLFVGFLAVYGQIDNVSYTEDAVIVLGAGVRGETVTRPLKLRLDCALEYHRKNPDALIVVSGGQGTQEDVTEASAMEKYLLLHGIDPSKIVKEENATSTNENMRFSKDILDEHFEDEYKIAVITNNFHIYRGVSIAHREGFEEVSHIHAGLSWYNLVPSYLRETLAVLKMWVLD